MTINDNECAASAAAAMPVSEAVTMNRMAGKVS